MQLLREARALDQLLKGKVAPGLYQPGDVQASSGPAGRCTQASSMEDAS